MIRIAVDRDFDRPVTTECELRICGLRRAYGMSASFIRFLSDEYGSVASVMDGVCVLQCNTVNIDEWIAFLCMDPDVRLIRTTGGVGALIAQACQKPMKSGIVMVFDNTSSYKTLQTKEPSIREVYKHLASVFADFPTFDGWYVDVSHRVRHGCCHITAIEDGPDIVSTAMTVAETEHAALIGGVATSFTHRKKGYASRCIKTLLNALPQKAVYIAPINTDAQRLYQSLGFAVYGTWAEISLL